MVESVNPDELNVNSAPPTPEETVEKLKSELEALQYENAKLKKINTVLTQRVEMGWGNHADAYRSFESAALLADKVKERTRLLHTTLQQLEDANLRLHETRANSERTQLMLQDAIESIPESFVLFDSDRRLVLANNRFIEFWRDIDIDLVPGETQLRDLQKAAVARGLLDNKQLSTKFGDGQKARISELILRLKNNRWIQMSERPTSDGGLVVIYTDITSVKEGQEKFIVEQARVLQSTLDNLALGVALVNASGQLETWNPKFMELTGIAASDITRGRDFKSLMGETELADLPNPIGTAVSAGSAPETYFFGEKTLSNGRVLLIRRNLIPGGGFVDVYADYTDRFYNQAAIAESEHRIRLITDALPAMISYVNKDLVYEFVNKSFEDWFMRPRDEICGCSLIDIFGKHDYLGHKPYIDGALSGRTMNFDVEQSSGDWHNRSFRKTYIPHFSADRTVLGFFALEQDITAQRRTAQALQQAYEYMEQRVNTRTREISDINLQLRQEIQERHQVEANLIEAKRNADHANESKTRFLAAASHDLLQPMNAARLFSAALRDQPLNDEAGQLVESLVYSLANVEALISSLVDISKLEAGVVEAVPESFNVDDLLHKLVAEYKPQAAKVGLGLNYVASSCVIHSDSQLLARILRNLLSNAVRYTQQGRLLLGCRRRRDGLEIQVWDTGVGIDPSKFDLIFEEFSRIEAKQRRTDKGLGLGLAIVERITRVLGHTVKVSSKPGVGSCFSVIVPIGQAKIEKTVNPMQLDTLGLAIQGSRILVIDNDQDICDGMRALLSSWQCDVLTAQSIEELTTSEELPEFAPQLIIADYHLDDETGLEAVTAVHQRLHQKLPVIMITADYSNELRQIAKERGYIMLNKPVKPLKLKVLMSNFLSRQKQESSTAVAASGQQ